MDHASEPALSQLLTLAAIIALSCASAVGLRRILRTSAGPLERARSGGTFEGINPERLKLAIQIAVLRILLPFSALTAALKGPSAGLTAALFATLGFFIPLALFGFYLSAYRASLAVPAQWRACVAASMGGGNRGIALLLLLASLIYNGPEATTLSERAKVAFVLLDFGNFAALLVGLPFVTTLISAQARQPMSSVARTLRRNIWMGRWDFAPLMLVGLIAILARALPNTALQSLIESIALATTDLRSFLITYLSWLYVCLSMPTLGQVRSALAEAVILFGSRVGISIGAMVAGGLLLGETMGAYFLSPEGLALATLLLAPVSSLSPFILAQSGAPRESVAQAGSLVAASTFIFATLSLVLCAVALLGAIRI